MTIRPYRGSDFGAFKELIIALQEFERGLDPARAAPDNAFAEWYAGKLFDLVNERGGLVLVAEEDGRVAGCIAGYADEEWEYREESFTIAELSVLPDCRGRGIGTALMKAMEEHAAAAGYKSLGIGVIAASSRVQALYRRLGYADSVVRLRKTVSQ